MAEDNERQSNPFGLLSALSEPIELRGTWFNNKVVKLDGYKFIECRFDNCELHISSSNIHIERCYIDNASTLLWGGDVVKAIRLFNSRYEWAYQRMPYFTPERHPDGTLTIAI